MGCDGNFRSFSMLVCGRKGGNLGFFGEAVHVHIMNSSPEPQPNRNLIKGLETKSTG